MPYPWDVLGLDGPAGEADIRRAYARKLKTIDLATDGEAFQDLVAARGQALRLAARHTASDPEVSTGVEAVALAPAKPDADPSAGIPGSLIAPEIATAHEAWPAAENGGWDELTEGTDTDTSPGFELPGHLDGHIPASTRVSANEAEWSRLGDLRQRLEALPRDGWSTERAPDWDALLHDLALLPVGRAKRLENFAIEALASLLLAPETFEPLPWHRRWRRSERFLRPSRYHDRNFLETVLGLATLYGWLTSDQALWDHLDPSTAERLLLHLRAAQRAQAVLAGRLQPGSGTAADVELPRRDLATIFQDEVATKVSKTYDAYVRSGRWPVAWHFPAFVMAPIAMVFGRLKPLLLLWGMLAVYLPAKSRGFEHPYDKLALCASIAALASLHLWVGAYWYRGYVRHAQRVISRADRLRVFHPELRWTFLSGLSPDASGNPISQRTIGQRVWFAVCILGLVLTVLRYLATLYGFVRS